MGRERNQQRVQQQIDFLPDHYREEYARRRSQVSQILVVFIFATLLPMASLFQYRMRLSVEKQLAEIDQHHAESKTEALRLARLDNRLAELNAMAQLAVYLEHPWPHTQIVAALIEALPATMSLDEIVVQRERAVPARPPQNQAAKQTAAATVVPAEADRQSLKKQTEGKLVVRISGTTLNSRHFHDYLSRLGRDPLFAEVELDSIESEPNPDGRPSIARFDAHLAVQPACGIRGKPIPDQQAGKDHRPPEDGKNPS